MYITKMHTSNVSKFVIKKLLRWKDRGFKKSLRKKKLSDDDDSIFEGGNQEYPAEETQAVDEDEVMGNERQHFHDILKQESSALDFTEPEIPHEAK